ncbi:MAG: peptidylprolyl isomerase [Gammaproteobacteria bacterium]|nr:peptidylprolyl isomerase [Gammaproteobacteria bacterium]
MAFKHPLFLFSILGLALFFFESLNKYDRQEITVTLSQQERLATLWETQTGYVATPEQLNSLVTNWIEEEILYQEALKLGLDDQDSIVRRRLIQKLSFIAESGPSEPADRSILQNFHQENLDRYTLPERYTFRQLYFETEAEADNALLSLKNGKDFKTLAKPSMLNSEYAYNSELEINAIFGIGFFSRLDTTRLNLWQGPLASGLGFHLIDLIALHEEEITPFENIQGQISMDYQRDREENARNNFIKELTDKYTITIELK